MLHLWSMVSLEPVCYKRSLYVVGFLSHNFQIVYLSKKVTVTEFKMESKMAAAFLVLRNVVNVMRFSCVLPSF